MERGNGAQEGETVGLFHFLNEIMNDYSYNAIFAAIDESKAAKTKPARRKVA